MNLSKSAYRISSVEFLQRCVVTSVDTRKLMTVCLRPKVVDSKRRFGADRRQPFELRPETGKRNIFEENV